MASASNSKKTVMDVSKPGKTAATATSRPVIITHGAIVKDPMVNEEAATDTPAQETQTPLPSTTKKVITPLSDQKNSDDSGPEDAPSTEAPTSESEKTETSEKPAAQADVSEKEPAEPEAQEENEEAVVDAVVEQVTDKKAEEQATAEEDKRRELVTKLITEKKYFVPLAVARHNRNNKLGILLIAVAIPLLVGVVLAIDAGFIGQGIELPFDLIKR